MPEADVLCSVLASFDETIDSAPCHGPLGSFSETIDSTSGPTCFPSLHAIFDEPSLGDESWNLFTAVLNLGVFNGQSLHSYSGIFEQKKPLHLVGLAAEFKFESKF